MNQLHLKPTKRKYFHYKNIITLLLVLSMVITSSQFHWSSATVFSNETVNTSSVIINNINRPAIVSTPSLTVDSDRPSQSTDGYECPTSDGYDEEAISWSNIDLAVNTWGQQSSIDYKSFLKPTSSYLKNVVIAIIDSGISSQMWSEIEDQTNCNIEKYIRIKGNKYAEYFPIEYTSPSEVLPWEGDRDYHYSHGSKMAWTVSQIANGVTLWIIDVYTIDDDYAKKTIKALEWLNYHCDDGHRLDIVSMSLGWLNLEQRTKKDMEDQIDALAGKNILIFAAGGNGRGDNDENVEDTLRYPRSFENVWGVGFHFDDIDGKFEDGQTNGDYGYRISHSRSGKYRSISLASEYYEYSSEHEAYKSVHFVAPGFDYETKTRDLKNYVADGSSMACPHVASIAALTIAATRYSYGNTIDSSIWEFINETLTKAAEVDSGDPDERVKYDYNQKEGCQPNSNYPTNPVRHKRIGYGSVDAYDSVRYVLGGEIVHGQTTVTYGNHNGNKYYSKSTTKIDIFNAGEYAVYVNYRINDGSWHSKKVSQLSLDVGQHTFSDWVASTTLGDVIEVQWSLVSAHTGHTLDRGPSAFCYLPPVEFLDPISDPNDISNLWDCHIDAQGDPGDPVIAHLAFKVYKDNCYLSIKVEYRVNTGSGWGPTSVKWHKSTKNIGNYYYNDIIGTVHSGYSYRVKWTIYYHVPDDDNINLLNEIIANPS